MANGRLQHYSFDLFVPTGLKRMRAMFQQTMNNHKYKASGRMLINARQHTTQTRHLATKIKPVRTKK